MIDFINVSKTYPNGTHALYGITLSIDKGEFVFIVGASGAGKSTFLKLIMHEETPTSGKIVINDTDVTKLRRSKVPYMRRHMGIVFQDFRLIDKMNVFDNVAFAMRAVGKPSAVIKKRVPYVLELVGLKDKMKNRPSELSGGEQQRVSLARALVNNPEIIIADEPTGNVDPEMSREIIELLNEINATGTTVIVVTHEHDLVRELLFLTTEKLRATPRICLLKMTILTITVMTAVKKKIHRIIPIMQWLFRNNAFAQIGF